MRGSTRTVAAIGAGYVLGRRHKFKMAAVVAAAAAAGSTTVGGVALRRGAKLLGSAGVLPALPPEISEIVDTVRADLVPAGKAAVSAAATSRMDALTDAIHERAELVRDPGAAAEEAADKTKRTTGKAAGTAKRTAGKATDTEDRDEGDEEPDQSDEEPDEAGEEPDEAGEEPVARVKRTTTRRRSPVAKARR